MKKQVQLILTVLLLIGINVTVNAQKLTQVVRGRVIDKELQIALPGATIQLLTDNTINGVSTDADGNFKLENVPVGRHDIKISFIGYKPAVLPQVLVGSAKEIVLNVELEEMVSKLNEVKVLAFKDKAMVQNTMAMASARNFSVEETSRYAGGFDDPARLATSFAGVAPQGNMQSNAIVIRGNSPMGVAWQVEGMDIPIPSHFANSDVLGGGAVTMFSNQMLSNSDFYTSAFPAEFGNATSGVFDVNLRTGNNEKYEHAFQIGAYGIDAASEGPLKKGGKASYLFNYRYSTLGLVRDFLPEAGLPKYQDLCYNIMLPSKAGTFQFWGMGGIDNFRAAAKTDSAEWTDSHERKDINSDFYSGTAGMNHKIMFGKKTYLKTSIAASYFNNTDDGKWLTDEMTLIPMVQSDKTESRYTIKSVLNTKFSARHSNRTGVSYNRLGYQYVVNAAKENGGTLEAISDLEGATDLVNAFSQSKFKLNDKLSTTLGLHSQFLTLNKKYTIEPRVGMQWQVQPKHKLSLAYGLHSQTQMLNVYFLKGSDNSTNTLSNKGMDFMKSHHFVLGYDFRLTDNMNLKIEPYFQYLTNLAVIKDSSFALINVSEFHGFNETLVSDGFGRNIGIDITLERYLKNGFYYLATASIFDSKYTGDDGVERNTTFNNNYIMNLLAGKEWTVGKSKNSLVGVSGRFYLKGGDRRSPVDYKASRAAEDVIYDNSKLNEEQDPTNYRFDLAFNYRYNKPKYAIVFSTQINNLLMSPIYFDQVYDYTLNDVREVKQGEPFPNCSIKIEF